MRRLAPVLRQLVAAGEAAALVTVAGARGSTPRELGTRMLVTPDRSFGTIGGGRLEFDAIAEARRLLAEGDDHALREVPLGPALGQCCGGHATVLIERAAEADVAFIEALDAGRPGVAITRLDAPAPKLLCDRPDGAPEGLREAVARVLRAGAGERASADGGSWLIESCTVCTSTRH